MNKKEYNKKYYEANKKIILKQISEKVWCGCCNKQISKGNISKHIATERHMLNKIIYEKEN